jgi:hypothetical protein
MRGRFHSRAKSTRGADPSWFGSPRTNVGPVGVVLSGWSPHVRFQAGCACRPGRRFLGSGASCPKFLSKGGRTSDP